MKVTLGEFVLSEVSVEMRMEYRIGRRIEQGSDGDDIFLEGRKSREFTLSGKLSMEQLRALERVIHKHQPIFRSDFGEFKVAVKSLRFRSETGEMALELVEDIA